MGESQRQEREKGWGWESERVGGERRDRGGIFEQPVCELKNSNDIYVRESICVLLVVELFDRFA